VQFISGACAANRKTFNFPWRLSNTTVSMPMGDDYGTALHQLRQIEFITTRHG
jgi:hypothetical protein